MLIGIDIRTACGEKQGKGWYTFHLIRELLRLDKKNEYVLYSDKVTADCAEFHHAHIKILPQQGLWWHLAVMRDFLSRTERIKKEALFFAPTSYIIPALISKKIKTVITVHDLVTFLKISAHQTKASFIEKTFLRRALGRCAHVLVPSQSTKQDLLLHFPKSCHKITITPEAAADIFFQKPADDTVQTIRKKYSLPDKFILTVGGLQPRKNIGQLIDATEFLKIPLVIVGGTGWKSEKNQAKVAAAQRVQHLTDCSAEELAALYHMATLFVFPTLYEGFGIPILEAMAAGCPVICSNTSSMPEVAGDAAILINPQHTTELRDAIQRVWNSPDMRQQLRQKGFAQAQDFSWKKCAQKTLGAFNLI